MATLPPSAIHDEVSRLTACALFAPGEELDRMLPRHLESHVAHGEHLRENPDYLLFDDLVLLPLLRDEHAELAAVIRAVTGPMACLDIRVMLAEVLARDSVALAVLDEVLDDDRMDATARHHASKVLHPIRGTRLAEALIQGVAPRSETPLLPGPAPNLLFARDLWAPIGPSIALGWHRHPARRRDGILSRAIVRHHPQFADAKLIDLRAHAQNSADLFLEGGDVLVASANLVLIGFGPRTSERAARLLASLLPPEVEALGVRLPLTRATMHLDTLVTFIDSRAILAYLPAFDVESAEDERCAVLDLRTGKALGCNLPAILGERL